jgi:hypothetical protein
MSVASNQPRQSTSPRHGVALVWLALVMIVLLGFVALGIDIGRMQLARTELQTAADGAARAAAWPIPYLQFADSAARAEAIIDSNDAGGGAIGYEAAEDLEYGIWWRNSRTFQPMPLEMLNRSNAARVVTHRDDERGNPLPMGFAAIVNFDEANIDAAAIAQVRGNPFGAGSGGAGIFGIDWVQTNGTTRTDSYDPSEGPYDPANAGSGGGIGSNGWIEIIGTSWIDGGTHAGPDGDTSPDTDYLEVWPNADVTGWQAPLDEELTFPPVTAPDSYNNQPLIDAGLLDAQNDLVVTGKKEIIIPGGTPENPNIYYINDLIIRANTTVTINGAVEFYVTGNVDMTGNVIVNDSNGVSNPLPSNFKLFVIGNGTVELGGGSSFYAHIYAPESDVKIHGTSSEFGLFGGVVGKTVDILGNSAIHVDENLKWPGQPDNKLRVEIVNRP